MLGTLVEGSLTGEICVIFNSNPVNTIESMSYCTIGMINEQNFLDFLSHFTKMKKFIIDQIIHNPYDLDREEFVKLCQNNVEFLRNADLDIIRKLY